MYILRGMDPEHTSHSTPRRIAAGFFSWLALVLVFSPFLTYIIGLVFSKFMGIKPFQIMQLSFVVSVMLLSYAFFANQKRLLKRIIPCFPDVFQLLIIILFSYVVVFPRILIIQPEYTLAVYDDLWHYQKIVSVFATFPDFKHYFFPDLGFSYYFYAYIIPSVVYTTRTGLNIKVIWLAYTFVTSLTLSVLMVSCFNRFLPRKRWIRIIFVLAITFVAGFHEWFTLFQSQTIKHTEWWALKLGLPMQVSSFFTINFWAPQHLYGLAIFCLVVYLIRNFGKNRYLGYICGLLIGIQVGFSVYVAAFTCLYLGIFLIGKAFRDISSAINLSLRIAAAAIVTILPIVRFFMDRENSIAFTCDFSQVPAYLLFLLVEFGVFLVLFVIYAYDRSLRRQDRDAFEITNICFVLTTLVLIFFIRSKGFNVFSYRGIMPAQIIIFYIGSMTLFSFGPKYRILKYLVFVLLAIQATGFIPELMAMTKDCYRNSYKQEKLPKYILNINNATPFESVIKFTEEDATTTPRFKIYLYNIFRMKDVDRALIRKGRIDKNNLVYLNKSDRDRLLRPPSSQ